MSVAVVAIDVGTPGGPSLPPVALAGGIGLVLGVVASRVYRLRWNDGAARVVGRIDALGVVVLASYLLVVVLRGKVIALWLAGAAGFAVLAGLMVGQVVGTAGSIGRVASARHAAR